MAEKRMFSKKICQSGKFLKMPLSTQALYFHLGLSADDDGIVEGYNVLRMTYAQEDDLRILVSKGYIKILNSDDVAYIMDWNQNNYIRADRYRESIYQNLVLEILPNTKFKNKQNNILIEATTVGIPVGIPNDNPDKDNIDLDKNNIDDDSMTSSLIQYACRLLAPQKTIPDGLYNEVERLIKNYTYDEMLRYVDYINKLKSSRRLGSFDPNATYIFTTGFNEYFGKFKNSAKSFNAGMGSSVSTEELEHALGLDY